MKRWMVVAGLAISLPMLVVAQTILKGAGQAARAEDDVVGLVRDWLSAETRSDRAALERILADGFIGTAFGGNIVTKTDILPPADAGDHGWPKSSLKETTARIFGDTGVVMGRVAAEDPSQPGEFRFTIVEVKGPRGWQMVAAHLSRPAPKDN